MKAEDDISDYPVILGFGSASTLSEYSAPQKAKKMRKIGFKFPKPLSKTRKSV